jgi:hypothetical protein
MQRASIAVGIVLGTDHGDERCEGSELEVDIGSREAVEGG